MTHRNVKAMKKEESDPQFITNKFDSQNKMSQSIGNNHSAKQLQSTNFNLESDCNNSVV